MPATVAPHVYHAHHAMPDVPDARDRLFRPGGRRVPAEIPLDDYVAHGLPHIVDQGAEHVCTGIALAVAANYLLRRQAPDGDLHPVSGRMLYEMARHHDGFVLPHEGSTARGAVKGWRAHGVCGEALWPFQVDDPDRTLTEARALDAKRRQLGAYHRVCRDDAGQVRQAIAEHGVVYVTL
ncbi:MAG: hypothetical protein JOY70_08380, partial [Acidisphaera sp.]|nr:hypothetical protein [Acidisphaera sp.]